MLSLTLRASPFQHPLTRTLRPEKYNTSKTFKTMENSFELKSVPFQYADYAGEFYEVGADGYCEELAKADGFTVATTTRTLTGRDGKARTVTEYDFEVSSGGGYGWNEIYFRLEVTKEKAAELAERHGSALTPERRAELAASLSIAYTSRDWSRCRAGQAKDWEDMDAAEVSDGRGYWTVSQNYDTVSEFCFTEADDESAEELAKEAEASAKAEAEARAFCDAFNAASEELQDDARKCQGKIDDAERATYESDCEQDNRRATFDKWKEVNGIESELEIWDCETDEKAGTPGVYEVDEDGKIRVKLELSRSSREVPYIVAK